MWPTRDIVTAFCNFFFIFIMLMQSHIGHRGSRPITWVYKFKLGLLMGSRATKLVVGVHWFPLRLGITLLWLDLMICHSNYYFQAIVSYWGEALQGKTWLPMKISIYLSIYLSKFFFFFFWRCQRKMTNFWSRKIQCGNGVWFFLN